MEHVLSGSLGSAFHMFDCIGTLKHYHFLALFYFILILLYFILYFIFEWCIHTQYIEIISANKEPMFFYFRI